MALLRDRCKGLGFESLRPDDVRSHMHELVDFAVCTGLPDFNRNPMRLVQNKGAMRRVRKPRSLTAEEFASLLNQLREQFATVALVSVCLGL